MPANAASIAAALERRAEAAANRSVRIRWFINELQTRINTTLRDRMRLAVRFLADRIVVNISKPVVKEISKSGRRQRTVVTERSKRGEFPRADTTQLLKTLIQDVRNEEGSVVGYVGSPMGYAIPLELILERQFLTRTMNEEAATIREILTATIE